MYSYLVGVALLKSIIPHFRKDVLHTLHPQDLLYINTFFITCFVLVIFFYKYIFERKTLETIDNYRKLSLFQLGCMVSIAAFTVISTLFIFELDKKYNNIFINSTSLKAITMISAIIIGILLFKDDYSPSQISGIFITILGIYLMTHKNL
jgi:drug/metabolite transporter (DMT)-like permease